MKERIQELAEQSTINIGDEFHPIDFFHKEKFAELIVRECLSIVEAQKDCLSENVEDWSELNRGYSMAVNDSVDMIKQHLGVEK
jgi:hypothetical protein